jgi:tetratricopeptide (TPR) repeat protein
MKRLTSLVAAALLMLMLVGCSQARKESLAAMNEGVALAQQRSYPEAIAKFEHAGHLDPTNDMAFYNLAMTNFDLQAYGAAAAAMRQAISVNATSAMYQDKLATILLQLDPPNLVAAKAALEKCVQLDPTLFRAQFRLAQVLEQMDDDQHALERYTEAIRRGPRLMESYIELGRLYAQVGFPQQALQVLRAGVPLAIEGSAEQARLHHVMGTVHQELRAYEAAVREFRTAVTIKPGMADSLFSLGWTYSLMENREEAIRYLNKFIEVAGPEVPDSFKSAARDRISQLGG